MILFGSASEITELFFSFLLFLMCGFAKLCHSNAVHFDFLIVHQLTSTRSSPRSILQKHSTSEDFHVYGMQTEDRIWFGSQDLTFQELTAASSNANDLHTGPIPTQIGPIPTQIDIHFRTVMGDLLKPREPTDILLKMTAPINEENKPR